MNSYLNHFKFDDTASTSEVNFTKNKLVVLGERRYKLNKSKEKFLSIGLAYNFCYEPCIKLFGAQDRGVVFNEYEWNKFLTFQGTISYYLYSNLKTETLVAGNFIVQFELCCDKRGIKILKDDGYIYLEYETVCMLWELVPLVKHTVSVLRSQQFSNYFKIFKQGLKNTVGSIFVNALNILQPQEDSHSANINMVLELIYVHPEIFENECNPIYYDRSLVQ